VAKPRAVRRSGDGTPRSRNADDAQFLRRPDGRCPVRDIELGLDPVDPGAGGVAGDLEDPGDVDLPSARHWSTSTSRRLSTDTWAGGTGSTEWSTG
jgi:hypothetical protein